MKVISVDDAKSQLDSFCTQALGGEVIRLQNRAGALVELTPVVSTAALPPLDPKQLADCYEVAEWAAFENHCAKVGD